jgi:hypothetical protein
MESDFHRAPYKRFKLLGARAPHSLETAWKVHGKTNSRQSSEDFDDDSRSTWKPAVLGYEELGGLSDPGQRDCS